jgi:hypothetical protein
MTKPSRPVPWIKLPVHNDETSLTFTYITELSRIMVAPRSEGKFLRFKQLIQQLNWWQIVIRAMINVMINE